MIDINKVREIISTGLSEYLTMPVIRSNSTGEPPGYPYISYTLTTPIHANNGSWGEYEDGGHRKPFRQTWSITVQADDAGVSLDSAVKAYEWFDKTGILYLSDNGVLVERLYDISNRDNMLTIEYEYRLGFDVVLVLMAEVGGDAGGAEYIESVDVGDISVEKDSEGEVE